MLRDLGAYSFPEKVVTVAVLVVMLAWITRKKPLIGWGEWMSNHFGSSVHDYMPVMAVAIILAIIPERNPFSRGASSLFDPPPPHIADTNPLVTSFLKRRLLLERGLDLCWRNRQGENS